MPLIQYINKRFSPENERRIALANSIFQEYHKQGLDMSVRQLYYQFVSRKFIPNKVEEYNKLQNLISEARMAGLVDWFSVVDRTRNLIKPTSWEKPSQIIEATIQSYHVDHWFNQSNYVEVWVEKDALRGIVDAACYPLDVPHFSCRGYSSQTELWNAAQRLLGKQKSGKTVTILHCGDHDPSGLDMSRDIKEKLSLFMRQDIKVRRVALNMSQIEKYDPPPDPAKHTDPRYAKYRNEYGDVSWELDALQPDVLVDIIQRNIKAFIDEDLWKEADKLEIRGKDTLKYFSTYYPQLIQHIRVIRDQDNSPVICNKCGATQNNPTCKCNDNERPRFLL